ncbi:MAG TPA: tetratricopeptide repeat protein [Polyangiaceae bacterium]|nr:tetratricopeptide repeat protein [Polyangiaceae bacterium]
MSNDDKLPDFSGIDWDVALDEWEQRVVLPGETGAPAAAPERASSDVAPVSAAASLGAPIELDRASAASPAPSADPERFRPTRPPPRDPRSVPPPAIGPLPRPAPPLERGAFARERVNDDQTRAFSMDSLAADSVRGDFGEEEEPTRAISMATFDAATPDPGAPVRVPPPRAPSRRPAAPEVTLPSTRAPGGLADVTPRRPPPEVIAVEVPALTPLAPTTTSGPQVAAASPRADVPTDDRGAGREVPSVPAPRVSRAQPVSPASGYQPRSEAFRPPPPTFSDEKPAHAWLAPAASSALAERAAWIEEEARATESAEERARLLLACSELRAIANEPDAALLLAAEARQIAPHLPLAWAQTRGLAAPGEEALAQLDAEVPHARTSAARVHMTLLAADIARIYGDEAGARDRWEQATKLDALDVRPALARACAALGEREHTSAALRPSEVRELEGLDEAVGQVLALRGARAASLPAPLAANDALRGLRGRLTERDFAGAQRAAAELGTVEGLGAASAWLSSAFGALSTSTRRASQRALRPLVDAGDRAARRAYVARCLELSDVDGLLETLATGQAFTREEEAVLISLAGGEPRSCTDALTAPGLAPLAAAISGATSVARIDRARHVAGSPAHGARVRLARLVAAGAPADARTAAYAELAEPSAAEAAIALHDALEAGAASEIMGSVVTFADGDPDATAHHLVRALVAETANDRIRAKEAIRDARRIAPPCESLVRLALSTDASLEAAPELLMTADALPAGVGSAILRVEALARETELPDATRAAELQRALADAPHLGIAAFLAERVARRLGDEEEALRLLDARSASSEDPVERALDAVRAAWLETDPAAAAARLAAVVAEFPADVALRDLRERLAPGQGAEWREAHADASQPGAKALYLTQAALAREQEGDTTAALAAARRAVATGAEGAPVVVLERLELSSGEPARLADPLLAAARSESAEVRRDAYQRLAEIDGRKEDAASALLWHRALLEEQPGHLPSLRFMERALLDRGRSDDLEPIVAAIAETLLPASVAERSAHTFLAAELQGPAPESRGRRAEFVKTAYESTPAFWSTRAMYNQARERGEDALVLESIARLLETEERLPETAALLVRASQAAWRLGDPDAARDYLEQAAATDPGDVVTWAFLADARAEGGNPQGAAEACESQARTSVVPSHQLAAWYRASQIWLEKLNDEERGVLALEQAMMIDAGYSDVFDRLSALYGARRNDVALVELLELRLAKLLADDARRLALSLQLAQTLAGMGDPQRARDVLDEVLAAHPEDEDALFTLAELQGKSGDHEGAEATYLRLSRLTLPARQSRRVFDALADLYLGGLGNLSRAEVALMEVLKRAPEDRPTLERLVVVHRRQDDVVRALEVQQQLVALSSSPEQRTAALVELAAIYETVARDPRKAEATLEALRKELPLSVTALRALASFFERQGQTAALHVLLDRAAGDARRAFSGGRFVTALFEVLGAAYELRGKADAARVVAATLAAIQGQPAALAGVELRASAPELDELLAPEVLSPALRGLLRRAGDSLDRGHPFDLGPLAATPLDSSHRLARIIQQAASSMDLSGLLVLVSPKLGPVAIPGACTPPTLVIGERLLEVTNDAARIFQVIRALKLLSVRASALVRGKSEEVNALVSAWLTLFNPSWEPSNVPPALLEDMQRRLEPTMPAEDPALGVAALEAAGLLGTSGPQLRAAALGWANRVALLSVGDPSAALDAIAWSLREDGAPDAEDERAAWIARHAEARDLLTFSVSDAYTEARAHAKA